MKKLKLIFGVFLLIFALALVSMALLSPDNGLFTALWNTGIATFQGESSLMVIYLISGLSCLLGIFLLVSQAKSREGA